MAFWLQIACEAVNRRKLSFAVLLLALQRYSAHTYFLHGETHWRISKEWPQKSGCTAKIMKRLGPVFQPDWGLELYVYLLKALRFFQLGSKAGLLQ